MGLIYAIANQKGGVGKTTTAINLGAFLSENGQRVLLVDIDPQANATSSIGVDKENIKGGTYEVLIDKAAPEKLILHNPRLHMDLLPANPGLAGASVELVDAEHREQRLRSGLEKLKDKYDYILIDCPPSLGLLTINGLVAANDGVIIPVQCEYLALEGLGQLVQTLNRIRSTVAPQLKIRGVLMTMFDSRTNLSSDVVEEVRKYFPDQVFDAVITRSVRLAEAPSYGIPISLYDRNSAGGKAYQAAAKELLTKDRVAVPAKL
ncbi:MAG: ParA family protein [Chloroflexi bacterium]|jgi:chromosome partitioning protein|nr:ParA family protein [Chloroflexota bacterium]